jgi:hypothetical protein
MIARQDNGGNRRFMIFPLVYASSRGVPEKL